MVGRICGTGAKAVEMMGEMSLDGCDEKSVKKNDQEEVDGMRQEVDSKCKVQDILLTEYGIQTIAEKSFILTASHYCATYVEMVYLFLYRS